MGFDTLGSDMATMTYRTENSIVIDQFHILSALLNCGVDENTVFRALTVNPAKYLEYTPDMAKALRCSEKSTRWIQSRSTVRATASPCTSPMHRLP